MTDGGAVVVTGAGGLLGASISAALMRAGYRVAALDRSQQALDQAAEGWKQAQLGGFRTALADQTDRGQVDESLERVVREFGGIEGVVANAGYAKFGGFLDMPAADWQRHVDINLTGTFHTCQAAARHMAQARSGGWLTVIASNLALTHADQVGAYCTTKAALLHMVRGAAAELGVHHIRVNAILPGVIDTAMTHGMLEEPGARDGLLAKTPLGRLGTPDDVTSLVLFLASAQAAWITGASILVDGGQSIYGQPTWVAQDRRTAHEPRWTSGYPAPQPDAVNDLAPPAPEQLNSIERTRK
jgi:NAD(P)-dependent dehydrogenase (short-subunit alcohol dehydrogenase family)